MVACEDCSLLRSEVCQLRKFVEQNFSVVLERFDNQDKNLAQILDSFSSLSLCPPKVLKKFPVHHNRLAGSGGLRNAIKTANAACRFPKTPIQSLEAGKYSNISPGGSHLSQFSSGKQTMLKANGGDLNSKKSKRKASRPSRMVLDDKLSNQGLLETEVSSVQQSDTLLPVHSGLPDESLERPGSGESFESGQSALDAADVLPAESGTACGSMQNVVKEVGGVAADSPKSFADGVVAGVSLADDSPWKSEVAEAEEEDWGQYGAVESEDSCMASVDDEESNFDMAGLGGADESCLLNEAGSSNNGYGFNDFMLMASDGSVSLVSGAATNSASPLLTTNTSLLTSSSAVVASSDMSSGFALSTGGGGSAFGATNSSNSLPFFIKSESPFYIKSESPTDQMAAYLDALTNDAPSCSAGEAGMSSASLMGGADSPGTNGQGNKMQRERCPICGRWSTLRNMKRHIDMVHGTPGLVQCPYCVKCFKWKDTLRRHVKASHPELCSE